jgi:branched-chain amino acid transport system substrate-binding protein
MRTSWYRRLVILAILLVLGGCEKKNTPTLVIGAVLPMTGDAGTFGQNAARGAELAVREANNKHLLPGLSAVLKVEDSRGKASDAVSAATKLIDVSHAKALIGDVTSAGTQAIIPIVTRAQVPVISPAASDPALSGSSPFFARVWPSDVYEAVVIGDYAQHKAYKRIAMLYANTDYGLGMAREFKKVAGEQSIVLDIPVDRETPDYRPTIQRISNSRPDAIFLVFYPEDARRFLQQLAEQRIQLPILATATFEDPAVATAPLADHVVFASPVPPSETDPNRASFVESYTKTFGSGPGVLSDTGYDAAMILIQAYAARGAEGPKAVADYIRSIKNYEGVSGRMSFNAEGDVQKPYKLRTVRLGKFVWLEQQ